MPPRRRGRAHSQRDILICAERPLSAAEVIAGFDLDACAVAVEVPPSLVPRFVVSDGAASAAGRLRFLPPAFHGEPCSREAQVRRTGSAC